MVMSPFTVAALARATTALHTFIEHLADEDLTGQEELMATFDRVVAQREELDALLAKQLAHDTPGDPTA